MSNITEFGKLFGKLIVELLCITAVLVYGVASIIYLMKLTACDRTSVATGLPTKFVGDKWVGGCFIQVDGKWIESANYGMGFTQ